MVKKVVISLLMSSVLWSCQSHSHKASCECGSGATKATECSTASCKDGCKCGHKTN